MNKKEYCNYISSMGIKSILYEVASTPKPGLVDRNNPGAHDDMDFFTFLSSASVLNSYFYDCTKAGIEFEGKDYRSLLNNIRPIGIKAEKDMFKATKGVNTHKGIIFSLGIIAAVAGNLFRKTGKELHSPLEVCNLTKLMTKGITKELEDAHIKDNPTYGERLYIKYGIKGIRGEVESGFKTVLEYSFPMFSQLISKGENHINDILVQILLYLMANTEDSNILGRHNMEILYYSQNQAKKALELGGYFTREGKAFVEAMDRDFIEKNISSGGAADLLAITIMLYLLENGDIL